MIMIWRILSRESLNNDMGPSFLLQMAGLENFSLKLKMLFNRTYKNFEYRTYMENLTDLTKFFLIPVFSPSYAPDWPPE